ncbi:MAG TPA: 50S ribosomal protein P1 [Candidatus Nanoarchaeia archaeon]|nr:50S ribosomal protein P1 [Candidatus Nanoarchaeia archaeon]
MEYVYGALLLHKAGQPVNEENVKKVLTASGVKVDEVRVKALVAALDGVDIEKTIKEASVPVVSVAPVQVEAKKEEKKKEEKKSEEQAAAGLGSLFG